MRLLFFQHVRARARAHVLNMFLLLNLFLRQLCRPLPFLDRDRQAGWGYEKEWSPFGQGLRSWPFKSRTKAGNRRRPHRKRDGEVRKRTKRKQGRDTSNGEGLPNETYRTDGDEEPACRVLDNDERIVSPQERCTIGRNDRERERRRTDERVLREVRR